MSKLFLTPTRPWFESQQLGKVLKANKNDPTENVFFGSCDKNRKIGSEPKSGTRNKIWLPLGKIGDDLGSVELEKCSL